MLERLRAAMTKHQATSADLQAIAEAKIALDNLGKGDAESISEHTGIPLQLIEDILVDPVFQDLFAMFQKGEFKMWAGIIAKEQREISKLVSRIGYDAVMRLKELIHSENEKTANAAIRTALEYNSELERPVVRHEITTRFTQEELDKARELVRKLKMPSLPAPSDGAPN